MIEIANLSFKYPGQTEPVFTDFSLRLEENKVYGLLGKNGTGKSTLLYLISGLLRPATGSVCVDDTDAYERQVETLREIFLVPEEFDLPSMTLKQYVKLNAPFYPRFSREVLEECLKDFELTTDLKLQALSMGQKKKVFMSFALAANTRYLLMDEPTNGLDIPSKSQFRKVVTLLNASTAELTEKYKFEYRSVDDGSTVIYSEPSLQGNAVMAERQADDAETQLNLELLFNAVTKGLLK